MLKGKDKVASPKKKVDEELPEPGKGGEDPTGSTSYYGTGTGVQNHQRGSSGSDAGVNEELSTGDKDNLSERGGGTGIRETEAWGKKEKEKNP